MTFNYQENIFLPTSISKNSVEWLIEYEKDEIEKLERKLAQTSKMSSGLLEVLESMDLKLSALESRMRPIFEETRNLSQIATSIDKRVEELGSINKHFEAASIEKSILEKEPRIGHLTPYFESIDRLRLSFVYIKDLELKDSEDLLKKLCSQIETATLSVASLFKRTLSDYGNQTRTLLCSLNTANVTPMNETKYPIVVGDGKVLESIVEMMTFLDEAKEFHYQQSRSSVSSSKGRQIDITSRLKLSDIDPRLLLAETRSSYLLELCENLLRKSITNVKEKAANVIEDVGKNDETNSALPSASTGGGKVPHSTGYSKGTSPFLELTLLILRTLSHEWKLVNYLYSLKGQLNIDLNAANSSNDGANDCFEDIIATLLARYREAANIICSKAMKIQTSDMTNFFFIYDVLEIFAKYLSEKDNALFGDWQEALKHAPKSGDLIYKTINDFVGVSLKSFDEFSEEIKNSGTKITMLPEDGTVHEISSDVMSFLKRIVEYSNVVEVVLQLPASDKSQNEEILVQDYTPKLAHIYQKSRKNIKSHSRTKSLSNVLAETSSYVRKIIQNLIQNLESKSKAYKKDKKNILPSIFLLNNINYLYRNFKTNERLVMIAGSEFSRKLQERAQESFDSYQESWKSLVTLLMDTLILKDPKNPSKSEKQTIKDSFSHFGADFDEQVKLHRKVIVPDLEIKDKLVADIKKNIIPLYSRFLDKYRSVPFTSNPDKYIKYDVEQVNKILEELFDSSRK